MAIFRQLRSFPFWHYYYWRDICRRDDECYGDVTPTIQKLA